MRAAPASERPKLELTALEKEMLAGTHGQGTRKSMQILVALGEIYGARRLIEVSSVQIAGVSFDNLGDAGLEFLEEMARDGRARVLATLNPAGMDLEGWARMGIDEAFAEKQIRVVRAFEQMGVRATCTCTPYLAGNQPHPGEHIAWSESSAVCYANSILGARTNREGGPSALASALTGRTAEYGLHLDGARKPAVTVEVRAALVDATDFGALGHVLAEKIGNQVAFIKGVKGGTADEWKSLCASAATYGGTALFLAQDISPEKAREPAERIPVTAEDLERARAWMNDPAEVDFVAIGCPHCSLNELRQIAGQLEGKKVTKETWIAVARPVKESAEAEGIVERIERSGAKVVADTCFVVAPIRGRFRCMATNSAKGVFYARNKNRFRTVFSTLEKLLETATSL